MIIGDSPPSLSLPYKNDRRIYKSPFSMFGMKNNKKLFSILFSLFAFSMIIGLASAAPTLVTPATSAVVTGSAVAWNVTNGTIGNMSQCNLYLSSASTANSTYVNISTYYNTSASAFFINGTFDSVLVEDSNDYSILAECSNTTAGSSSNSSANTGITIDNGVPTAPSALSPSNLVTNTSSGTYSFSATVDDPSTTACTIYLSSANSNVFTALSSTYSTTSCSATNSFSSPSSNGDYLWYAQASDGSNTTNSAVQTLYIRIAPNQGGVITQQQANQLAKQETLSVGSEGGLVIGPGWIVLIVIVLVIIAVVVIKKRRK